MNLPQKLANVRRATRLLASYYRRAMTVLSSIDREVLQAPHVRLKFMRWEPTHHTAIGKQTTSPFGRWGWDFLPLMDAWFQWSTDGKQTPMGPGSVLVAVQHVSDDGYDEDDDFDGEPDPSSFQPAEDSSSVFHIWIYALVTGACSETWSRIDEEFSDQVDDPFTAEVLAVPTSALDGADVGTVIRYIGWTVKIADLETEDDVEREILAPVRNRIATLIVP